MKKDFVSITDLKKDEILELFEDAIKMKKKVKKGIQHHYLKGKTLAMIFEKPSLRTRVSFEVGMFQLGGTAIYLAPSDIKLGVRESVPDVARNLSRWVSGIMARTFAHKTVVDLAENATIPVINGLSDLEHPCQILADFLTILEHKKTVKGLNIAWVGDGNNVCHSLMLCSAMLGSNMRIAVPKGYEPNKEIMDKALEFAKKTKVKIELFNDPFPACKDADVIYTDVWTSMGQEEEKEKRMRDFKGFQVNKELLEVADKNVIVMHCLPAHRGEEITDDVLDGIHSVVLDEAENRLHAQKALLVKLMG
uniref:Ornithine carbamoyltransferase n=1 Tax=candidate division WOR-3 bacterium TaxID=2052148 RepID=A0A7C4YIC2_UNCW3